MTPFGRELVRRLGRHGIVVDVAHVNRPGVLEACDLAEGPVFCTHTGVRAVHDHPRNISDEEIDAIAGTGGSIGVMFSPVFLSGRWRSDSSCIVEHIDHIASRVGTRHLSVGTDYDGWIPIPRDQRDCRDLVRVTQALLDRGVSPEDLRGILRDNAIRVLSGASGSRGSSRDAPGEGARSAAR